MEEMQKEIKDFLFYCLGMQYTIFQQHPIQLHETTCGTIYHIVKQSKILNQYTLYDIHLTSFESKKDIKKVIKKLTTIKETATIPMIHINAIQQYSNGLLLLY